VGHKKYNKTKINQLHQVKVKRNRVECEHMLTVGYFGSLEEECEEVTEIPYILFLPRIVDHGLGERDREREKEIERERERERERKRWRERGRERDRERERIE
jgi:hypothetical protein